MRSTLSADATAAGLNHASALYCACVQPTVKAATLLGVVAGGRAVVGGAVTVVVVVGPTTPPGFVVVGVVGVVVPGRVVTVGIACWIPGTAAPSAALPVFAVVDVGAVVVDLDGAVAACFLFLPEPRDASRAELALSSPSG